jgi:2-C-methyl-D-erythritol 4-phosphate cytidylyltransferase
MRPRYFALIPAGGSGSRFGTDGPKQYAPLCGEPLLLHSLRAMAEGTPMTRTYVGISQQDRLYAKLIGDHDRVTVLQCGGATRAETVKNGLELMRGEAHERDWVLVHDAARPCLAPAELRKLLLEVGDDATGGLLAVPVADTLKRADAARRITGTPSREGLWQAQTPQMFRYGLLLEALRHDGAAEATDEAQAIERLGAAPLLVEGSRSNIKVTYASDLPLAEAILKARRKTKGKD